MLEFLQVPPETVDALVARIPERFLQPDFVYSAFVWIYLEIFDF